jgi:hypothetical protein
MKKQRAKWEVGVAQCSECGEPSRVCLWEELSGVGDPLNQRTTCFDCLWESYLKLKALLFKLETTGTEIAETIALLKEEKEGA